MAMDKELKVTFNCSFQIRCCLNGFIYVYVFLLILEHANLRRGKDKAGRFLRAEFEKCEFYQSLCIMMLFNT